MTGVTESQLAMRTVIPQAITALRAALGGLAVVAALEEQLYASASLLTLSAVLDGIDGRVARWLGGSSAFGALFDYFVDYLCFIVAPWCVMWSLAFRDAPAAMQTLSALPLITGAARYARSGLLVVGHTDEVRQLPGLGTVFYAFVAVTAVFLEARSRMADVWFSRVLGMAVPLFSILMLAPVRYPKLTMFRGASTVVLCLLTLMPFVATAPIAWAALVLGLLYVVCGPWLGRSDAPANQVP